MRLTKTFPKGGIHPHGYKELTCHSPIRNAHIPSLSVIPMHQNLGKPAECIVKKGDKLREGMLIGRATGFFSANVHCPVPGTVTDIKDIYLPSGIKTQAVVVELEGEFDRSGKNEEVFEWKHLSAEELNNKINDMGIVGLGGASFPTHIKYKIPEGKKCEYFVINGVECEPFLTADHRLMLEKPDSILKGAEIVRKILNPDKIVIGIEKNKPDAIAKMAKAVKAQGLKIKVVPLKVKYPQGDEKQLLKAITGREVPSGGLPIDIGAVVSNVGTVFSIYEAIELNKPVIERTLTVTGSAMKNPSNLKVKIGTMIRELIEDCGGTKEEPGKVICGGPMMGAAIYDLDTPVIKGMSGILVLSKKDIKEAKQTYCLQCGKCVAACPLGLNPTSIYKWIDHQEYDEAKKEGLLDCKECGSCNYMCPARIPLVQGMRLGKRLLAKNKKKG